MEKGYIENGFIVELSHASKISDVIYELSRILDMPESKNKQICLKLGSVALTENELNSVKTLVELMNSQLSFISTSSEETLNSASALGIQISEFTSEIEAPTFESSKPASEVEKALDKIFGEDNSEPTASQENAIGVVQESDEEEDLISDEESEKLRKEIENLPTLYIRRTIRSGQSISSDGSILIIGDVNPGAEIVAKGDVTVWGVLGGIAHAGSDGNNYARIRALKLNPVQVRIGEIFARRPDSGNMPFIQKSDEYIPEEAYTSKGNIIIKKIHSEI